MLKIACIVVLFSSLTVSAWAAVPFVGCASDGQTGPVPAPRAIRRMPQVAGPAEIRLAFYAVDDSLGVLAPRNWHCIGLYGSNGRLLLVTPEAMSADSLLAQVPVPGPAVQLSVSLGDTSGRFDVARVAARLFPSRRAFVQQVIAEDIEPAKTFPMGPFPGDTITRRNDQVVEYDTPAGRTGMGTTSRLVPGATPISGVAILTRAPDSIVLASRMPPGDEALTQAIIVGVESRSPR